MAESLMRRQRLFVLLPALAVISLLCLFVLIPVAQADEFGFSPYPPPPPESPVVGDVNSDGSVNIIDAMFIAQFTVGLLTLTDAQELAADTDGNKSVNIVDAMHIAQYSVDPTGSGKVLFKPLWEWPADGGLWDPLGQNSGKPTSS